MIKNIELLMPIWEFLIFSNLQFVHQSIYFHTINNNIQLAKYAIRLTYLIVNCKYFSIFSIVTFALRAISTCISHFILLLKFQKLYNIIPELISIKYSIKILVLHFILYPTNLNFFTQNIIELILSSNKNGK